jgi:hypothetical protein
MNNVPEKWACCEELALREEALRVAKTCIYSDKVILTKIVHALLFVQKIISVAPVCGSNLHVDI